MSGSIPSVLFVTRKWAPAVGGMETWAHRLSEGLAKLGPVEVVALPGNPDGSPPGAWRLALFPFAVLRHLLARGTPAVLHLGDMALWPLGLLAPRAKVVLSAHGTDVSYHRRGGLKGCLYGLYLRLGARLMRRAQVVANSAATARAASETGWADAAIVPLATDMAEPATDADANSPSPAILFAGRLVARKGCGWFVREVLPALPPQVTLRIAGTHWDANEAWVAGHPRVRFLGPLAPADLAREYAEALCVVVPNIEPKNGEFEGFGLVACEAAAAGGVVLAARTGGLVEAVRDGETGTLLPPGDAAAWIEAIGAVRAWNPADRAERVAAARRIAREYYTWPRVARETAAHYVAS